MDLFEAIANRRSIRKYLPEPVPEAAVETLIRAAMAAPSAGNQQAWHFIVITDRSILDAIPDLHPHSKMLREAPMGIAVCADLALETKQGYWIQDCAAAVQNMLLAAHGLGLGACWLGIHPRPEREAGLQKMLSLPQTVSPLAVVAVGYAAEQKQTVDRFNPERIHRDRW
jgi:nitroreductase